LTGEGALIERKFLGVVEVDSGSLVIGDPGYLLPRKSRDVPGIDFQEVIDTDASRDGVRFANGLTLLFGVDADGPYPVYGDYEEGELFQVRVVLDPIDLDEADAEADDEVAAP
jgi:hypothetical protein